MTATWIFLFTVYKYSSTAFASGIKSICVLPQVGHEVNIGILSINPSSFKITLAALTSSKGSPVKETLIVFPIPNSSSLDKPIEEVINPLNAVPASVIPTWSG